MPNEEIVKAYQVEEDEFVYLTDEDFEAAAPETYKTITIHDFVPAEEIDPIYFERTYFLGPADTTGEPVYALLVKAMEEAGLVAVATYVFHERENLGCLRVRDGVLTLEKMFFADEVRPAEGIAPDGVKVDKRQLEMAMQLIGQYQGEFDPDKYHDQYRERLMAVIEAKRSGEGVKQAAPPRRRRARSAGRAAGVAGGGQERRAEGRRRRLRQPLAAAEQRRREVAEPADPLHHRFHRERGRIQVGRQLVPARAASPRSPPAAAAPSRRPRWCGRARSGWRRSARRGARSASSGW